MKYIIIAVVAVCILFVPKAKAQTESKQEFRATWVASVANIDWPKYEHRGKYEDQKNDLIQMLNDFQALNFNAILLQVRSECDAMYNSTYEPWSRYLSGTQGTDPGYDPLQFAIDEAHKRGIELHAWMNPYRINASTSDGSGYYHTEHIYLEHPEWAMVYPSNKKILNPGLPEVMSYIGSVVRDLVENYEVDGVHFDDYFYGYEGTLASYDQDAYDLYGGGMARDDWRRDNVNRMIDTVYKVIQETDPDVRFGVSPFGIYKNGVPQGIVGLDAYSVIYCDPLAWLEGGDVDYITPQMYWPTGGGQDFETLAQFWSDTVSHFGRHLYAGQGSYRLSSNPDLKAMQVDSGLHESKMYFDLMPEDNLSNMEQRLKSTSDPVAPWTLGQIGLQIDIIRSHQDKAGLGSVFFSAKDFRRVNGLADYLQQEKYTHVSLAPEMTWKPGSAPAAPQNITTFVNGEDYYLTWDAGATGTERFYVYSSSTSIDPVSIVSDPDNLQGRSFTNSIPLAGLVIPEGASLVVTAVSRIGKESDPSALYELAEGIPMVELVSPADSEVLGTEDLLKWRSMTQDTLFQLQVSGNSSFSNVLYTSDWIRDSSFSISPLQLDGETDYFWRARAKRDAGGPYSAPWKFRTGYPAVPELTAPESLQQLVSTRPRIEWTSSPSTDSIRVLISESSSFDIIAADDTFDATAGEGIISGELGKNKWFYARIKGINEYGSSGYSADIPFKTTSGEIPEVKLLAPADQSTVSSFDSLRWETTTGSGSITYLVEISLDANFSSVLFTTGWIPSLYILASDLNLEGKRSYYWRVKAKSEFGESDYTEIRNYTAGYPTRPSITSPGSLSENNDVYTTIGWTTDPDVDSVYVEFAEDGKFTTVNKYETFVATPGTGQLSSPLQGLTWYFARIQAINGYGSSVFSASKYFRTEEASLVDKLSSSHAFGFDILPNVISGENAIIRLKMQRPSAISIQVYNAFGSEILMAERKLMAEEGVSEITLNRDALGLPGVYLVRLTANGSSIVKRIFLVE